MTTKQEMFLATRADAFRRGDRGVYKAMTAELAHLGYSEPERLKAAGEFPPLEPSALSDLRFETAQSAPMEEAAVPPRPVRRGRPPKISV